MEAIISTILTELIKILIMFVLAFLVSLINQAKDYIKTYIKERTNNIKDNRLQRLTSIAIEVISNAVDEVQQTYVDELKKNGTFDKEAQETAFYKASNIVESTLNDEVRAAIEEQYGDVHRFIEAMIESTILRNKGY